ncbi:MULTISPECIES: SDR family NAD(P)-dependent oxidoreductase [Streptomyces]|uniref:SDR family NAD(P)-dependent oxidoreductase n=1 Tax=Streptomyces TaxID=1883 RepID=UPI00068EF6BE|nr:MULTISPECIES: SDR family oxidoreductase [Streptomyces]MBK3583663.1 SDR family oxidoreductase [Streptomyces sp. MBT57]OXZ01551.1 hypothetical protein BEH93_30105 [Streptomyces sp. 2R]QQZ52893.1 SDR family oxidoreductase [Streptomyces microflavus]QTA30592.1 3-phenylpropionate-dihydrodiol/cinnamic acid-dihydrodiol dehydrogenase [Streptomyces sp. CA-256286]WSR89983.1 SDR family oxidoreductase [Streptomyces microflavus]
MDSSDQVALVTGGGRGIGQQIALALARSGARVAVLARSRDELEATAALAALGGDRVPPVLVVPGDMTDQDAVGRAVARVTDELGPVSLLVNNAAAFTAAEPPFWEADLDTWWHSVEVNVRGTLVCTRAVLPSMVAEGRGRIITVSSDAGMLPYPLSSYSFGKNAQIRLTETLDASLKAAGRPVRTFAISPGTVRTRLTESFVDQHPDMVWTPAEHSGRLVLDLASGRYDALHGRYLSVTDDLDRMLARLAEVERDELFVQRMRRWDTDAAE